MKNAIILHGMPSEREYYDAAYPSASNSHWIPWLQKQLLMKDIKAHTPEVSRPFDLNWNDWLKEVERFEIGPETILVGHSCGAGFWLRYLSDNKSLKVGKVVLVAPWLDVGKEYNSHEFFDFELDSELALRTRGLVVFNSNDDEVSVQGTVNMLKERLNNFTYKEFQNYGHFTFGRMQTDAFPELLEECLKGNT